MRSARQRIAQLRRTVASRRRQTPALAEWLASLDEQDGVKLASTPTHFGGVDSGEEAYARQFARDEGLERRIGDGLRRGLSNADAGTPALEIGAGTGILSRPLVASTQYPRYVVTDTSPEFLRLTRSSIDALGVGSKVDYVVLSGDELQRLPEKSLSLVAMRYTLHHVLDWERFMHIAGRLLVPGGALLVEEPCADGFLLQAALADVLRRSPDLQAKMPESVRSDLAFMVSTTYFYANCQVDKTASEDKHVFPVFRLLEVCREAGLTPSLFPNQGIDDGLDPRNEGAGTFAMDFRHNLAVNFGFGAETLEFFDQYLAAACSEIASLSPRGGGPIVRAVIVARNDSAKPRRTGFAGRENQRSRHN